MSEPRTADLQASSEPWAVVTRESEDRVEVAVLQDPSPEQRSEWLRDAMHGGESRDIGRVAITLPTTFEAKVWLPEVHIELGMTVRMEQGRVVCDQLIVKPHSMTVDTELLRKVPVALALRLAATASLGLSGEGWADHFAFDQIDMSRGPTPEVLTAVAAIYSVAYAVGDRPTRAVGQALDVPRSTATGWVTAARRRGFLGETDPRQQGGSVTVTHTTTGQGSRGDTEPQQKGV